MQNSIKCKRRQWGRVAVKRKRDTCKWDNTAWSVSNVSPETRINIIPDGGYGSGDMSALQRRISTTTVKDRLVWCVKYEQILDANLSQPVESLKLKRDWLLQQDDDPKHTSESKINASGSFYNGPHGRLDPTPRVQISNTQEHLRVRNVPWERVGENSWNKNRKSPTWLQNVCKLGDLLKTV